METQLKRGLPLGTGTPTATASKGPKRVKVAKTAVWRAYYWEAQRFGEKLVSSNRKHRGKPKLQVHLQRVIETATISATTGLEAAKQLLTTAVIARWLRANALVSP